MPDDDHWLRRAFARAKTNLDGGEQPFAAILVDREGEVLLECANTRTSTGDCTAHAELLVCRGATVTWERARLAQCTIYSSTEPCPMCAGAIAWSGIGRLVFGLSQAHAREVHASEIPPRFRTAISCRTILDLVDPPMAVLGPLLGRGGTRAAPPVGGARHSVAGLARPKPTKPTQCAGTTGSAPGRPSPSPLTAVDSLATAGARAADPTYRAASPPLPAWRLSGGREARLRLAAIITGFRTEF